MEVFLYNFAKRNKSTLQINHSGIALNCTLKESTSVTEPVLLFQTVKAASYNYVYIPDFGRYYFITSSQSVEGMWEIGCEEDELATYKTEIGATIANILYASGATKNIPDSRIPVLSDLLINHNQYAIDGLTITTGMGAIILGITGKGSFGSYLMQYNGYISELLDGLDAWQQVSSWQDEIDGWKQFFYGGSASECLKSAIALPLVIGGADVSSSEAEALYLGNYPCTTEDGTNINGFKIDKPILKKTTNVVIPWNYNNWRNVSAYTSVFLYLPLIGLLSLPASELQLDESLGITYSINVTSGDISVQIRGNQSGRIYSTASGNCAMNTAYGSTGLDTNRATAAVVSGIGTILAGAAAIETGGASALFTGAIGAGFLKTAGNTIAALGGTGAGNGGLGGGSSQGLDPVIHIWCISKQLTESQSNLNPIMGKPFMGVSRVDAFKGYVQTDGFQFKSTKAYASEIDKINQLLDSGIYFE